MLKTSSEQRMLCSVLIAVGGLETVRGESPIPSFVLT